ncbi:hypothetical protein M0805_001354 [Coniferiporia weirii]|nr:hypothetical protein M0805_001354 [Coniferiporia weirii]
MPSNTNVQSGASAATPTPTPPPLGTLIDDGTNAGALQLSAVLGYGGYGVVYRAVASSGGLFAVKCLLRTSNPNNPKQAQRQRRLHMREIALHRLAGAGAHPGIVRLQRIIEPALTAEDGTLSLPSPYTFLVMDYAPCGDLFTLILHKQVYLGRTGLVAQVFAQLADAVSHCHSLGIFHRDLKPENVLCWDGGATVRLADFGLATTERRSREWRTGSVYHMSPECQNGNPSSPPYSPLANDIWSLAILLLNLLTARNPWARASPSDPTFSAYLSSPRNFLPQVLPISSGLNEVLVHALDVRWEQREAFGVSGLSEGVARLIADPEELDSRRSHTVSRQRMGMYAPDVVFEGGMARCPWEVGMHIPSGSSGSEEATSNQIRIPEELVNPPTPQAKPEPNVVRKRSSSASFVPSVVQTPSPSFMIEASDVPPETPDKEPTATSRWSNNSSASPGDSTVSEIRFANASDADELTSSASGYSTSSSEVSSVGSSYSVTRTPGVKHSVPEPRVSDADLTLTDDAEVYAYAYAASPDTPIESGMENSKTPYTDVYTQRSYTPTRRSRYRGRSQARQPYPQLASYAQRDIATRRARFQPRKHKPELRLNIDLPAFLPLHVDASRANGSETARTHSHSRSRSPQRSVLDLRRRAQEESVSSCPFAYSVSQSASFIPGPNMDVDEEREGFDELESEPDFDVHMISPSGAAEGEDEDDFDERDVRRFSRPTVDSESFHTSFDGFSISPSPISCTSPAGATEDGRVDNRFRVSTSGGTLTSPTSPGFVAVDADEQSMVKIERSTVATTSPTDIASPQSGDDDDVSSNRRQSATSEYDYEYDFARSSSPSASSSRYQANNRVTSRSDAGFVGMMGELMETDEFRGGFAEGYSRRSSEAGRSEGSWVDELHRMAGTGAGHPMMDTDDFDELPGLPGSFPTSPASLKNVARQSMDAGCSVNTSAHSNSEDVQGLGLDLFSYSSAPHQLSSHDEDEKVAANPTSVRYSAPPPSIRPRMDSADEALRELHAIAVETPVPWSDVVGASSWGRTSQSRSSVSTRGAQTFVAITTDMNTNSMLADVNPATNATVEDFREYVPYLRYAESTPIAGSSRMGNNAPPVTSDGSFRAQKSTDNTAVVGSSFRAPSVQCGETSDCQTQQRQDSGPTRRRSRPRSLLKFVSRRPFSASGAGFAPSRASQSPASQSPTTTPFHADPGLEAGADATSRFSAAGASKDGGRIAATMSDGQGEKSSAAGSTTRPRSSSSPPLNEQVKAQRIESPTPPISPVTQSLSHRLSANTSKSRSWSFTRSRSQSRRRSRSLSPAPMKGSPRDVLLKLRNARNWFWYALSSMTSRSSSGSGARSKKGTAADWVTPYVGVAA